MAIDRLSRFARKRSALLLVAIMLYPLLLFGPAGTSHAAVPSRVTLNVSERTLDMSSATGRIFQLTANVQAGVANPAVSWSSSDPAVAVVAPNGEVVAMGPGTAVITATLTDGGDTATCAVAVQAAAVPGLSFMVKGATGEVGPINSEVRYRQSNGGGGYSYNYVSPAPQPSVTSTAYGLLVTFPNVDWGVSDTYSFGFGTSKFAYARDTVPSNVGRTIVIDTAASVPLQVEVDDSLRTGAFAFSRMIVTFRDGSGTPILALPVQAGTLLDAERTFGLQVNALDSGHAYVLFRSNAILPAGGQTIVFPAGEIAEYDFHMNVPEDIPGMTLTSFAPLYWNGFNVIYHLNLPNGSQLTKLYLSKLTYNEITAYYTIPGQNAYGYSVDRAVYGNVTQNRVFQLDTNLTARFTPSMPYYWPGSQLTANDLRILDRYGNVITDMKRADFSDVGGTIAFTSTTSSVERQVQRIAGSSVVLPDADGVYAITVDASGSYLPIQPAAGFIKVGEAAAANMTAISLQAAPGIGLTDGMLNGVTVLARSDNGEEQTAVTTGAVALFEALAPGEWTFSTTWSEDGSAPAVIPISRLSLTVADGFATQQGTLAVVPRKHDQTAGRFSILDALWFARHQAAGGWDLNQDGFANREDIRYVLQGIEPYEFAPVVPTLGLN